MAFQVLGPKFAIAVKELQVMLLERDDGEKMASFHIVVAYNDRTQETIHGNLLPHLTPAQIANLQTFMSALLAQARAQLLPTGS